jgi:hypothetical protein
MAKRSLTKLLSDRGVEVFEVPAGKARVFRIDFGTTTKAYVLASGVVQAMKFAGAALEQHDANPHVRGLVHDGLLEEGALSAPMFMKALEMAEGGLIRWVG